MQPGTISQTYCHALSDRHGLATGSPDSHDAQSLGEPVLAVSLTPM